MRFFDTSTLLELQEKAFEEEFIISLVTLQELENIKTSANKDANTKYRARKLLHLLDEYHEMYSVVGIEKADTVCNNDSRIINDAMDVVENAPGLDLIFMTEDVSCKQLARAYGLNVESLRAEIEDTYTGFREIIFDDKGFSDFYSDILPNNVNVFDLLTNEYLLLKDEESDEVVDQYKWTGTGYKRINSYNSFNGIEFGETKAKDVYQACAMDSLEQNQLTVIRGPAGSGKSHLALGYLLQELEKNRIDSIVIFCNPVATRDSCKLGFYPGDKNTKLLDSQIGNFLVGKLGSILEVERLIGEGKLLLVPVADCRGLDLDGKRCGVYMTEAQNATIDIIKLLLQRAGKDSVVIFEGDTESQVDMLSYEGANNGLRRLSEVFRGEDLYGEITLQNIYRSRLAAIAEKM
jgi:predicted ribonuclease YlaK